MTQLSEHLQQTTPFILFENTLPAYADEPAWLFENPVKEIIATDQASLLQALNEIDQAREQGYYLAGYISYEAGYALSKKLQPLLKATSASEPLLQFYAFKKPTVIDAAAVTEALNQLPESPPYIQNWQATETQAEYTAKQAKINDYIRAGDTYQVNQTYRVNFELKGSVNGLYQALRERQPVAFSCLMHLPERSILSLSPELFVRKKGEVLSTKPMKGTAPRGATEEEDNTILGAMAGDEKQRSENLMIVDLMRNDVGRLAKIGSMKVSKLFEIQTYKTLHQMISSIQGDVDVNIPFADIVKGLFPCGSITGAPKIRTMEIIHELESTPRDIYTGAIGFITPDNDFSFNVPIRTISIPKNSQLGTLGIGGGIIYESDAVEEWKESQLKARFITGLNKQFKLIETFLYEAETQTVLRFEKHLARLQNSAQVFGFPFEVQHIKTLVHEHLTSAQHNLKVRLLLDSSGEVTVSSDALAAPSKTDKPLVGVTHYTIDADNLFRRHKTTNRALYNQAFAEGEAQGFYDVLFFNQHGILAEASRHNVYLENDGVLYTPRVEDGALPGVMRDALLADKTHTIIEKALTKEDLLSAERIYLSNSVRQLVEVTLNLEA
ncbi:aminodeoxychorismate synthase component I [Leucothrix sargassi]|nr:aminodeoxychorismate synthase component I [Leucothrix sargassi]